MSHYVDSFDASSSLTDLCTHVADLYAHDASAVSGTLFAHLAERLVKAEVQPGGPYRDHTGMLNAGVNAAVGRLFVLMGKPLPQVDAYIASVNVSQLDPTDKLLLGQYHSAKQAQRHGPSPQIGHRPYRQAKTVYETLAEPVRTQALHFLARVAAADTTREIANIAAFTAASLNTGSSHALISMLGVANIHSWVAYMLYDHIIDGQTGTHALPTANIAMRLALAHYRSAVPARHATQSLISTMFDEVDTMNAWELTHCRFTMRGQRLQVGTVPDYADEARLASKSAIHILGPLLVAHRSPLATDTRRMQALTRGLRHYLVARQLADDIHDWKEDLYGGCISPVSAYLLTHSRIKAGEYDLPELMTTLQHDFVCHSMQYLSKRILHHTAQATTHLQAAGCGTDSALMQLVNRLIHITKTSLTEHHRLIEFGRDYTRP